MTKGKKASKREKAKRVNNTAHQRALENPETQAALSDLRERWNDISAKKRGEQLLRLIGFGCSVRGIADDLVKPASNIRRDIALANSPEPESGWIELMNSTIAKRPPKQKKELSRLDASREARMPPKKKSFIKRMHPAKEDLPSLTIQQPQKVISPLSTSIKARPLVNRASSNQQSQSAEHESKPDLVAQYSKLRERQINPEAIRRLDEIINSTDTRPIRNARSMTRQGKPSPQTDPNKPVS
ncbi:hypothetical protein P8935_16335 [Telmatobacter sp. DSM 110680]|uniref:Uncharacterized protein n=1 Tax=Telmatobacter sp. DSM 110680 TaxID=3036704 RepID=A0AAU7DDL9_9BACT